MSLLTLLGPRADQSGHTTQYAATHSTKSAEYLRQLRINESRTRQAFAAAGIAASAVKVIQCDVCGIADNALFWAYRGHGHAHLLLRCPTCGDYTHRYPIRPRAKHSSLDLAPVRRQVEIVAAIFLVGLPVYLLAAPTGRQLISGFEIRDAEAAPAAELSYRPEAAKGSETAAPPSERDAVLSPSIGTTVITEERSDPAAMTTFVAPGDRREHFRSEIADTEDDEDVLVEIRYLRDRDRTEVTLADPPPIWRVRLALHGWRPAGSP